eukprot:2404844-Amphidinium_carterae.1
MTAHRLGCLQKGCDSRQCYPEGSHSETLVETFPTVNSDGHTTTLKVPNRHYAQDERCIKPKL